MLCIVLDICTCILCKFKGRENVFQRYLRTEKCSAFQTAYNNNKSWASILYGKVKDLCPPPSHTQATYPLSGIKHDKIKRVSTQDAIDDCERVTGCHSIQ